ncbi:Chromodomain-helicase-DNA-binding protein 1-like [Dinochytrium kinnereticum]|nr:Chromodomain-helicase-DNA-binding protein 1-like [Dinochytrium kinnereticum]
MFPALVNDAGSSSAATEADRINEEKAYHKVLKAFKGYRSHTLAMNDKRRRDWHTIPETHRAMIPEYQGRLGLVDQRILRNAEFVDLLLEGQGDPEMPVYGADGKPLQYEPVMESDMDKVRSTLKQFVRDWSAEGQAERDATYKPIVDALLQYYPVSKSKRFELCFLIADSNLGVKSTSWFLVQVLRAKVYKDFFSCNEFSFFMLLGSNYILNRLTFPQKIDIFPWVHAFSNIPSPEHQLQSVTIPDEYPGDIPETAAFSMVAGDFLEVYSQPDQLGKFDSIVTCYFIDTAKNIIHYLEVISHALKPGGLWINMGPLLYHFEGMKSEISVDLNLEEVKAVAKKFGFEFLEESMHKSTYTGNPNGMLQCELCNGFPFFDCYLDALPMNSEESSDSTYVSDEEEEHSDSNEPSINRPSCVASIDSSRDVFLRRIKFSAPKDPFSEPQSQPRDLAQGMLLKDYQLNGVQWMNSLFRRGLGGILEADEMGLGKTIQAISFLLHLKHGVGYAGPYLIVVPLSVLNNWAEEFKKFVVPNKLNARIYKEIRTERRDDILKNLTGIDAILTTFDVLYRDIPFFASLDFSYLVVDEAHRLKNPQSVLNKSLLRLAIPHSLLMTGTPIQNNILELGALLAFVLRREKRAVLDLPDMEEYVLFTHGVEPEPFEAGEHLIQVSGKLALLDKLLLVLKRRGHRVLIFSQMTHMLDILQDYLTYRDYIYERLDGSVRGDERFLAIKRFLDNGDEDRPFVFLLSTRAGGVGLNLTAADVVIFFDSDFNPAMDMQAAARAHRIGQKSIVKVFRILSEADDLSTMLRFGLRNIIVDNDYETTSIDLPSESSIEELLDLSFANITSEEIKASAGWSMKTVEDGEGGSIYTFDGVDMKADEAAFKILYDLVPNSLTLHNPTDSRMRAQDKETIYRRIVELEKAAKRSEDRRQRQIEKQNAKWLENGYVSKALNSISDVTFDSLIDGTDDDGDNAEELMRDIIPVNGDISKPILSCEPAILIHVVDNSGSWPQRGIFAAFSELEPHVEQVYNLACENDDLKFGSAHIIDVESDKRLFIALVVAQNSHEVEAGSIRFPALEGALRKVAYFAKQKKASVHVPRIGQNTPGFDWYKTERILRKCFVRLRIPSFVYYFKRSDRNGKLKRRDDDNEALNTKRQKVSDEAPKMRRPLSPGRRS